jgi:tetratricopeptide (TPR) repeat protein
MVAADSKAKFLHDAERYVLNGKVQQAIGEYLKIVKFDPNDVMILNTIGDLYLRQGNRIEANKYFSQVADSYVRNNFFLKAIAVYKKILTADPNNLEINSVMASLYAKQGLSIDARNQYLRVAALLEKEGKSRECLEIFEKIVDLDPSNAAIQCKLAQLYTSEGAHDKAGSHWAGAARAQVKAGELAEAANSFGRAMPLMPMNIEVMRGFLECCLRLNDPAPALSQLKKSLEKSPDNLDLREMLGQCHLANNETDQAVKDFQQVFSRDESRYENFIVTAKYLVTSGEYDKAVSCLDTITSTLITRRETDRAAQLYEIILERSPNHILAMVKMSSLYSVTGDHVRNLQMMDKIADHYVASHNPSEAIEYIEKILRANPESEKHQNLHREVFEAAFPGKPYVLPPELSKPNALNELSADTIHASVTADDVTASAIVEVDLLINYGMREKALSLLSSLESRDPGNREVRTRLLSLYKIEKKFQLAAEQALLLAALCRQSKNEEGVKNYLAEAKQLDSELVENEPDIEDYAIRHGIKIAGGAGAASSSKEKSRPESEVDLSSDLLDIFFTGEGEPIEGADHEMPASHETISETFPSVVPSQQAEKSLEEQLQEVDFYIRLGFRDEALAKLNEIAKSNPNNPELESRFQKLGEIQPSEESTPTASAAVVETMFGEPDESESDDDIGLFGDMDIKNTLDLFAVDEAENRAVAFSAPQPKASAAKPIALGPPVFETPAPARPAMEFSSNEMFADLMQEVGAIEDQEILKESFEDHFSLGTAYRDMDLIEESAKEFERALKIAESKKETEKVIQCCGMLSGSFLKKGMPTSALRWCQKGLSIRDVSSHEAMALRYDMGIAHTMAGSNDKALECFDQIFNVDPGYRDVAKKIDRLKAGQ